MGARTLVSKTSTDAESPKRGNPDAGELAKRRWQKAREQQQAIVTQVVQQQGGDLGERQVTSLARTLKRSREQIVAMVQQAREELANNAVDYVNIHKMAVESALANGDAKSLEVAVKGSQWAMSNLSLEGQRVVDRQTGDGGGSGTQIIIGIKIGGKKDEVIEAIAVPPPSNPEESH